MAVIKSNVGGTSGAKSKKSKTIKAVKPHSPKGVTSSNPRAMWRHQDAQRRLEEEIRKHSERLQDLESKPTPLEEFRFFMESRERQQWERQVTTRKWEKEAFHLLEIAEALALRFALVLLVVFGLIHVLKGVI